jgi:hypothetical protein
MFIKLEKLVNSTAITNNIQLIQYHQYSLKRSLFIITDISIKYDNSLESK